MLHKGATYISEYSFCHFAASACLSQGLNETTQISTSFCFKPDGDALFTHDMLLHRFLKLVSP